MYTIGDRYTDERGYVRVYMPNHPRAIVSGSFEGYVYEHVLVAENMLGRRLLEGEVVHHLDFNKSNNSPDNLLVISNPMHVKLHRWLDNYTLTPSEKQAARTKLGCVRCLVCSNPILPDKQYCSDKCHKVGTSKAIRPSKEELFDLVWSKPTTQIAKDFNVSDKAIEKWCKSMDIEKPTRGYWSKHKKHTE